MCGLNGDIPITRNAIVVVLIIIKKFGHLFATFVKEVVKNLMGEGDVWGAKEEQLNFI